MCKICDDYIHSHFTGKLNCLVIMAALLLFLAPSLCFAGEGYGSHYLGGSEDFNSGNLPPAGTKVFVNYLIYYDINKLADDDGDKQAVPGLGKTDTDIKMTVDILRFVHVTHLNVLNGNFVYEILLPVAYQDVDLKAGGMALGSQSKTGIGDMIFGAALSWHPSKTFSHLASFDLVTPTGSYDKNDAANIGRNYWSMNAGWAYTYCTDENSALPGFEISGKLNYYYNTVNNDTDYKSGQEFAMDYFAGQHLGQWGIGLSGYYLSQLTDDEVNGHKASDPYTGERTGVRGQIFTAGPIVNYTFSRYSLTFKYQKDLWQQNKTAGDKFWVKAAAAF